VIFYALALYLFATGSGRRRVRGRRVVFALFRALHSAVHCTVNVILVRFALYLVSTLAVWFIAARAALATSGPRRLFKYCPSCGRSSSRGRPSAPTATCRSPRPGERRARARAERVRGAARDLVLVKLGEPWELRALARVAPGARHLEPDRRLPARQLDRGQPAGSRGAPARLAIYVSRADLDAVREFAAEFAASELAHGGARSSRHDPTRARRAASRRPRTPPRADRAASSFPRSTRRRALNRVRVHSFPPISDPRAAC
jgi:hypothetical protein